VLGLDVNTKVTGYALLNSHGGSSNIVPEHSLEFDNRSQHSSGLEVRSGYFSTDHLKDSLIIAEHIASTVRAMHNELNPTNSQM
jgi:hypothetical protein